MKITSSYPSLRMRRNRKSDWIRRLVSEHNLSTNDLILPLFVKEGVKSKEPIKSMPNIYRYSINGLCKIVEKACKSKIFLT